MTDREKVAKAIRCRLKRDCSSCPYDEDFNCIGCEIWMWKALELLEDQKPRVLTLDEVCQTNASTDFLWLEIPDEDGEMEEVFHLQISGYLVDYTTGVDAISFSAPSEMGMLYACDYGKTWRCWSARPTNRQRKAVQWDA